MDVMEVNKPRHHQRPKIAGDRLNVLLLMFLYTLENISRGMANAIAFILQSRDISYADQAEFSLIMYPYCFKLLWAPIVDCIYVRKIGRRKSWAIPTQYLIGVLLFIISMNVDHWLGSEDGTRKPQVRSLTVMFFTCIFLCTVLEITVDGWALTMLKSRNIGHAGTCNNTGYVLSQFLGFVLFILLDSETFCNKFRSVPQNHGFITISDFIFFWSVTCFVSGTFILLFKKDNSLDAIQDDYECRLTLKESYVRLWDIMQLAPVREMCFILFTYQIGLGPSNGVASLKLLDAGVASDTFALLTLPSIPFMLVLPFMLSDYFTGQRSMRAYVLTYKLKLVLGATYAVFIFFIQHLKAEDNELPTWHYWLLLIIYNADAVIDHLMYVAIYAFFSRVSDPRFGGMYVTLLFALSNIGYQWPISFCLWLVDLLTIESCVEDKLKDLGECTVIFDGYYTETILFVFLGIIWLCWAKRRIYRLEDMDTSEWLVKPKPSIFENSQ